MEKLSIKIQIPDDDKPEANITVGSVTEIVRLDPEKVESLEDIFNPIAEKIEKLVFNHYNKEL